MHMERLLKFGGATATSLCQHLLNGWTPLPRAVCLIAVSRQACCAPAELIQRCSNAAGGARGLDHGSVPPGSSMQVAPHV